MLSGFINQPWEEFSSDDFPGIAVALLNNVTVVVADRTFTKVVEDVVVSSQVD